MMDGWMKGWGRGGVALKSAEKLTKEGVAGKGTTPEEKKEPQSTVWGECPILITFPVPGTHSK